jgi:hypothetical protein
VNWNIPFAVALDALLVEEIEDQAVPLTLVSNWTVALQVPLSCTVMPAEFSGIAISTHEVALHAALADVMLPFAFWFMAVWSWQ